MKKLPLFFLLLLLLEISIPVDSQIPALLKYVLEWPPTFCIQLNSEGEGRCRESVPEHEFTLHGLLQADEEGFNIECDPGVDSNWDEVFEHIKDELVTFWPSLREDFNQTEFWKHEWHVHGSCGGTAPEEYFNTAIEINNNPEEGNLFNYLETSDIIASHGLAYSKEHIVEAIQKVFHEILLILKLRTKVLAKSPPPPPPSRSPPPPPSSFSSSSTSSPFSTSSPSLFSSTFSSSSF